MVMVTGVTTGGNLLVITVLAVVVVVMVVEVVRFYGDSKSVGASERKMHGGVGVVCVSAGMVCLQTYSITHLATDDNSSPINTHTHTHVRMTRIAAS